MSAKILWIERNRGEGSPFLPSLKKKGYLVEIVSTIDEVSEYLSASRTHLIVVNTASMTGWKKIGRLLSKQENPVPILAIARANRPIGDELKASVVITLPFTTRLLLGEIKALLPNDQRKILKAGSLRLDIENRRVRRKGKVAKLTPRLALLLQVLMKHAGEVLERDELFKQVWNTEYTEDTRTLDVHISWLRQALEDDPREPQFLKTVRGVGYRLDV